MTDTTSTERDDPRTRSASRRLVGALTLTKFGDRIVDPKTVLAWFLETVGAPVALTGLLVPIRESGALLPQASISPWVAAHERRTRVWVLGAIGQALAAAGMGAVAATLTGTAAGVAILVLLAVFALARSLCSLSIKDVMGRTIPPGRRGRVSGWADSASGLAALTLGFGLRNVEGAAATTFAWLLVGGAVLWVLAIAVLVGIDEPAAADREANIESLGDAVGLLRDDADFRHFVIARTLLLASALTPPFVVALAVDATGNDIAGLGPFVIAAGLASLLGGRAWGRFADTSSRTVMAIAAGTASVVVVVVLVVDRIGATSLWPWVTLYFLLSLVHTGARVGRSTYVVELGDRGARTSYVAVSNTVMGLLLLAVGGVTALLAMLGTELALLALALLGASGVVVSLRLPETGIGAE
ncbi:MFS transporter [Salsipaludibacter albus]|uniref:MFS transporter n=1 Tax=Salsipaludibacter albus TaxID=2849650 RepID=UPI001EE41763|nr:MFS transporter [Salsipaludibacter albus]MBY5162766.1 MFS transporter [Salsipaludibacter albus]